jgi:hypothetical protein
MPPKRKKTAKKKAASERPEKTNQPAVDDVPAEDRFFPLADADQKTADRQIVRRSAAVALAVRGHLPISDVVLLVAAYEDLWIPNIFRQIETWYRRLNYRLSVNGTEAVEILVFDHQLDSANSHGYRTIEYALDSTIVGIKPVADSVVLIIATPKSGVFDFEPKLSASKEIVFRPTTLFDGFHDISFWISNARQCVYASAKNQIPACLTCMLEDQ